MIIRDGKESDHGDILYIHQQAFGDEKGPVISKLVDNLFDDKTAKPYLSLVAIKDDTLVGHILFTKAIVTQTETPVSAQILAPLAIMPDTQKQGIGQKLIDEGLKRLRASGTELVFVLGHPAYYPRCGFQPAGIRGFEAPYPIPEEHSEAWMVQALNNIVLKTVSGKIECSTVLNDPKHWRE